MKRRFRTVQNDYPMTTAFLEQAIRKHDEIKRMRGRMETLRTASTSITAKISDMPGSLSPNVQRFEDMMLKIVDLEKEILNAEIELAEIKADITLRIAGCLDGNTAEIMLLRYVDGMRWTEVADQSGLSTTTVYRLHHDALPVINATLNAA